MSKKVLVLGSGAREHALAWVLSRSETTSKVFCSPGNALIERDAELVELELVADFSELISFCRSEQIDFVVVGPEALLSEGVSDALNDAGIPVFGPNKEGAKLESSKNFAKEVMIAAKVPTAKYKTFTEQIPARDYALELGFPLVLKMDGLAAGKGVSICNSEEELDTELGRLFGDLKAKELLVEEFLEGEELSFIVMTDGERVFCLPAAHDYKRLADGDEGPNTGGMGTVAPSPRSNPEMEKRVEDEVIRPVLAELKSRGVAYKGFLYAGLMLMPDGRLAVLEFNARMGDPEAQVMLPLLEIDFAELVQSLLDGSELPELRTKQGVALNVVLASKGYPASSSKGDEIKIDLSDDEDCILFGAAVRKSATGQLETSGGRVLSLVTLREDLEKSRSENYRLLSKIDFPGMQHRTDIGKQ